jgi:hypothetical protein
MKQIRFKNYSGIYTPGDVATLEDHVAEQLIASGAATSGEQEEQVSVAIEEAPAGDETADEEQGNEPGADEVEATETTGEPAQKPRKSRARS